MKSNFARPRILLLVLAALLALPPFAWAQKPAFPKGNIAVAVYQPKHLYWEPHIAYASVSLRVVGPGGFVHDQEFGTGIPAFILPAAPGVADGQYFYELVFGRIPHAELRAAIAGRVSRDDGMATDPGLRASVDALRATYSGAFLVAGGQIVSPNLKEPAPQPGIKSAKGVGGASIGGPKDVVTADDAIIQGSLCVGLDCVNNESFGFDTIRLKENNTRIQFEDTSLAGFPSNNWQIRANDSVSGGASFLGFVDQGADGNSETGTILFSVAAGAPANSLFVGSTGKVGFRTSTPVLDLHAKTGNTPALRFEQDSSGGFTAQTWDIAGNEANFFVRDVTGGSRLPFRIRPGAPTSSIDINASGNVGIGTASPGAHLHVSATGNQLAIIQSTDNNAVQFRLKSDSTNRRFIAVNGADVQQSQIIFGDNGAFQFLGATVADKRLSIPAAGVLSCSAGIKSDANGELSCIISSRQFKNVEGELAPVAALANVMALRPQVGSYKATPDEPEHWLIAEEVAAVDPALVGMRNGEPYTVKTQGIIADLVAVLQEQQRRIEALERAIAK